MVLVVLFGERDMQCRVSNVFHLLEVAVFLRFEFAGCPLAGIDLDFCAVYIFFMVSDVDDLGVISLGTIPQVIQD